MSENIEATEVTEVTEVTVIETGVKTEQLSEFNLSENKITGLKKMFDPMLDKLQVFEDDYNEIVNSYDPDSMDIDKNLVKRAKRLRINISKVRTLTDAKGKEERAEANRYAKAVIGAVNIVEFASKSKENVLKQIETHAEKIEAERLRVLQEERLLIVSEYGLTEEMDFSGMAQTIFDNFVEGLKSKKLAEEEANRKQDLRISRQTQCLNLSEFIVNYEAIDLAELTEEGFKAMVVVAESARFKADEIIRIEKEAIEKEQQRIKDENAKLLKEKEESEAKAKAEKEAREAREADEKERQAEAQRIVTEEREKAEKEVNDAKEAEALKTLEAEEAKEAEELAKAKLKEAEKAEAERIESIKALAESSKEITAESIAKTIAEGKTIFVQVVSIETIEGQSGIFIAKSND